MTFELIEYESKRFPRDSISREQADVIWTQFGKQIAIEFPSPKTDGEWELQSQGYVGYVPLSPEVGFSLKPRVDIGNLFRMLEYAYRLKFRFFNELIELESLEEFYERLANVLAKRTLDRGRKGFYRSYEPRTEDLPYVRGSFDLMRRVSRPWEVRITCDYQDHTPDIVENQILVWTLMKIARSGACTERVLPFVRRAYRSLHGSVSTQPFSAEDCIGRLYNRLNDDYEPLHALCRFFLEHTGPSLSVGEHQMLPFLIYMPRLFELFVAEWLRTHLPAEYSISEQEQVRIGENYDLNFEIDLVVYDTRTGKAAAVLDTKYKIHDEPVGQDVQQILAYAVSKDCTLGILIYPRHLPVPHKQRAGKIRVRSLAFPLNGDLEAQGTAFLSSLLRTLSGASQAVSSAG